MFSRRLRCSTRASLAPARRASSTTCLTWLASSTATRTRPNTGGIRAAPSLADAFSLTCTLSPNLIVRRSLLDRPGLDELGRNLMPSGDCKATESDYELTDSHAVCQVGASAMDPPRVGSDNGCSASVSLASQLP